MKTKAFRRKNMDRPQFQIMLRDLRRIRPEYLVCYRLDRISRSVSDFSALIENLNKNGISFICIKEEFDTSKPMGKAMMYIASVFCTTGTRNDRGACPGQYANAGTRRTLARRYAADWVFPLVKHMRYCWMGKLKNYCILQEDPAEADIVRKIFAEYLKIPRP